MSTNPGQNNPFGVRPDKKDLIDYVFTRCTPAPRSCADLGGVWGVNGSYTFYALETYKPDRAVLVDTDFTEIALERARQFPQFQAVTGNFGDPAVAGQVGDVDAVFLFDVLLHQVKPDWDEVLRLYAGRVKYLVILNQQWTKEKTVRLLDLGRDEYFHNVPHRPDEPLYRTLFEQMYQINPHHQRIWRDIHNVWQWGITDHDMFETAEKLGFSLQYYKNCGRFGNLENFEDHAFVFRKR
jgi:hypothetical protein